MDYSLNCFAFGNEVMKDFSHKCKLQILKYKPCLYAKIWKSKRAI